MKETPLPLPEEIPNDRSGIVAALTACLMWGLLPLYWRQLHTVSPLEIVCNRVVWSLIFTGGFLLWRGRKGRSESNAESHGARLLVSSLLIACNWLAYIWAVNAGYVLDSSLGYFLSPLVNVFLGVAFLKERLSRRQGLAVALAFCGVLVKAVALGRVPWISLFIALTFSLYALVRKRVAVESVRGLFVETLYMAPPAFFWMAYLHSRGELRLGAAPADINLLLVASGGITAIPLILFAHAARRLQLSTLGLLQYGSPTIQFLLAVFVFQESFSVPDLGAFGFIWTELLLYSTPKR